MLESAGMAKTLPSKWPSLMCLCLALAACGHARIVRRDYSEPPASARRSIATAPTSAPRPVPSPVRPVLKHSPPPAPAEPLTEAAPQNGTYIVKPGDTLYGLARRFGLKFQDLAEWNRIAEPYAIQSGQRLHLRAATEVPAIADSTRPATAPAPAQVIASDQQPIIAVDADDRGTPSFATTSDVGANAAIASPKPASPAATTAPPKPQPVTPSIAPTPVVATPTPAASTPQEETAGKPPVVVPVGPTPSAPNVSTSTSTSTSTSSQSPGNVGVAIPGGPNWRWPTDGDIVGRYVAGDQTQQGIDISGRSGQAVIAAADGVVVYSGAGLVGYGELVIIKHSDEWLSAYAHNRRRLVAEGTKVKAGEEIAEMGRTGAISDMLHFEIRRNGKPVDPLALLPRR